MRARERTRLTLPVSKPPGAERSMARRPWQMNNVMLGLIFVLAGVTGWCLWFRWIASHLTTPVVALSPT